MQCNKKTIVISLTWYYLSKTFLKNKNEIIELDLEKIFKKKGISKN